MAPLPSNSTGVLFVDYTTCQEPHTVQVRFGTGGTPGSAMTFLDAFLTEVDPLLFLCTITGARVRDLGGSVTYPVTWTGNASYGTGAGEHFNSAWYVDFVGRSIGGRRVRIAMFGAVVVTDAVNDDYRLLETENTNVADTLAVLDATVNEAVAIDGDSASWHRYCNIGVNAYWRNRIRG